MAKATQADYDELSQKIAAIEKSTYRYMSYLTFDADESVFKACGYENLGAALIDQIKRAKKQTDKLLTDFERKYTE